MAFETRYITDSACSIETEVVCRQDAEWELENALAFQSLPSRELECRHRAQVGANSAYDRARVLMRYCEAVDPAFQIYAVEHLPRNRIEEKDCSLVSARCNHARSISVEDRVDER